MTALRVELLGRTSPLSWEEESLFLHLFSMVLGESGFGRSGSVCERDIEVGDRDGFLSRAFSVIDKPSWIKS